MKRKPVKKRPSPKEEPEAPKKVKRETYLNTKYPGSQESGGRFGTHGGNL